MAGSTGTRLPWNPAWVPAALIVLVAAVGYHNSFDVPLVFDDTHAIAENPTLRSTWREALSPPANSGLGGRPLANLSFALNHAWGGFEVRGYHAVNLLLHVGSALLLFGVVRRTLARVQRNDASGLAAVVALVWVAHPLNTAAVTYLSQRTELLMGFFYLGTLYAFVRGWWALAVVACALGMLSKEVMITAPVLVLLYDRTFLSGSFAALWRERGRVYVALAVTWLIVGWLLMTGLDQRSVGYGLGVAPLEYALNACRAVLLYVKLALWPAWLVFDYGRDYAVDPWAVGVLLAALLGTLWLLWRRPKVGFFPAAVLLLLAPTTSVVPVAEQPMAENRMYLPLAVMAAGLVLTAALVAGRRAALALGGAAALVTLTIARNEDYRRGIWVDTVAKHPTNPRAHYNHGVMLLNAGRAAEAERALREAVRLKPDDPQARNALGNVLLRAGQSAAARVEFVEATRLRPNLARAWYHAGLTALQLGDEEAARRELSRAVELDRTLGEAHNELGSLEFRRGRPQLALEHYREAVRLGPNNAEALYNAGSACFDLGQFDEAQRHFGRAVALSPKDAELRNYYGAALLRGGRGAEARAEFEKALRLDPKHAGARENLETARAAAK